MSTVSLATYLGLDPRITVFRAGDTVDAVFVRTARFDVLVDTLDTPESCRAALGLLGDDMPTKPLLVVNSHMDWDHFWGNAAVAGRAPIIAHEKALARFASAETRQTLGSKAQADPRFAGLTLAGPTVTFSERMSLHGGDLTLELLHTPGHTPDHVAVWIPELRVCLAVDAVEHPVPEVWSDEPEDLRDLVASLRRIRDLGAVHLILAHGQTSSPDTVLRNLRYFEALAERIPLLRATASLPEAEPLPEGLRLDDLVTVPEDFGPEARRFYERCHRSNLAATLRSRREDPAPG